MLVVRGEVADAGVQAHGVVLAADAGELVIERLGIAQPGQVRPLALQMSEERLDVRLIVGVPGRP